MLLFTIIQLKVKNQEVRGYQDKVRTCMYMQLMTSLYCMYIVCVCVCVYCVRVHWVYVTEISTYADSSKWTTRQWPRRKGVCVCVCLYVWGCVCIILLIEHIWLGYWLELLNSISVLYVYMYMHVHNNTPICTCRLRISRRTFVVRRVSMVTYCVKFLKESTASLGVEYL